MLCISVYDIFWSMSVALNSGVRETNLWGIGTPDFSSLTVSVMCEKQHFYRGGLSVSACGLPGKPAISIKSTRTYRM